MVGSQAGIIEKYFSSRKVLSFGQRSPRNRDEWYTSSPSSSVTLQRFGQAKIPKVKKWKALALPNAIDVAMEPFADFLFLSGLGHLRSTGR